MVIYLMIFNIAIRKMTWYFNLMINDYLIINYMFDKNLIIKDSLKQIENPVILEFGVNRGRSSQRFLDHILNFGGNIFPFGKIW